MSDAQAGNGGVANGFALTPDGSRWTFDGVLSFDNAAASVEAAQSLELPASGRVDLSGLQSVDSSALAVVFALKRRAKAEQRDLIFVGVPDDLASLARVYGVEGLF